MSKQNLLEVVRIKDPQTGAEYNATRAHAKNIGATVQEGKPTHDERTKQPIPTKARTDLAGKPAAPKPTEKKES